MQIRPAQVGDREMIAEIDGTIESADFIHVERSGEGLGRSWKLEQRPGREKLIERNAVDDETSFAMRQVASGAEEGLALVAEHEGRIAASVVAVPRPERRVMEVVDLRVDYDFRRQGLGTALIFECVRWAREHELRAVGARTTANNAPAAMFLLKSGFEPAGLDAAYRSNHDLVKEMTTLFWYAALD